MEKVRAIQTNGIGQRCTTHLNLNTTLAQVWAMDPKERIRIKPRGK